MEQAYQVCVLGHPGGRLNKVRKRLGERCKDLGFDPGVIKYIQESQVRSRDPWLPTIAIFFGYDGASDAAHPELGPLLAESSTIIPLVSDLGNTRAEVPPMLAHINALDFPGGKLNLDRVASLVLESFRLLRKERRMFISYKRLDSESLASKLYDELDKRGFDVFLDTRSVPPAADFQSELWHRMSDSDVVVLIDTPQFRSSRWTVEELTRANATNIQILHLLWPGQKPDSLSAFSEFYFLEDGDFAGTPLLGGVSTLSKAKVDDICDAAERLRARAIAARYRYLIDNFCDLARDEGLDVVVQPDRWIALSSTNGYHTAVVPAIGVPTSDRMNEMFEKMSNLSHVFNNIWLIYDNRGLLDTWLKHLDWLDSHLPIRAIRASSVGSALAALKTC